MEQETFFAWLKKQPLVPERNGVEEFVKIWQKVLAANNSLENNGYLNNSAISTESVRLAGEYLKDVYTVIDADFLKAVMAISLEDYNNQIKTDIKDLLKTNNVKEIKGYVSYQNKVLISAFAYRRIQLIFCPIGNIEANGLLANELLILAEELKKRDIRLAKLADCVENFKKIIEITA
jgi:hypothetical protein